MDTFSTTLEDKSAIIGGLPWVLHFVILYSSLLWIQEYTKVQFCLWFCMGVKLGL
jgi:hypothetical protein